MLKIKGKILFDPIDVTKKHNEQSLWKKVAIITFEGTHQTDGICAYYSWFIERRYDIKLNLPLRGAHVTLVNDRSSNIENWEEVKSIYNGKEIEISIDLDARTDSSEPNSKGHWWLRVLNENNPELMEIRKLLGLNEPFYSFHMSIGYANNRNIEQSKYIHTLIKKYGKEYN